MGKRRFLCAMLGVCMGLQALLFPCQAWADDGEIEKFVGGILSGTSAALEPSVVLESSVVLEPPAVSEVSAAPESPAALESSAAPEPPVLNAASAVLMDADSGRVLFEKDGFTVRPMASTTKIMTCILALENGDPDDEVLVSAYAASMPDVQLNIREGERYRLGDLLCSLMLESHNDTAVAIAEHIGGSVEGFAAMMNQKARDLGCSDTCFVTPNGLDGTDENGGEHSTTARDLAAIMRYCVMLSPKREEFLEITRTPSHSFTDLDGKRSFYCLNHNAYLSMSARALTGKTGFTGKAGYCYVGALKDGERTFIAVLLGCGWPPHKTYKWNDMRRLEAYGADNYEYREISLEGLTFPRVAVPDGQEGWTGVCLAAGQEHEPLRLLMRPDEELNVRESIPRALAAPVAKGQIVGSLQYYIGDELAASYPLQADREVQKRDALWYLKRLVLRYIFDKF